MIARLSGTLVERGPDAVVVDCGGVGYLVSVSLPTLASLPEPGEPVTLRVYTQVMENRIALYGFGTAEERDLFDQLITVKNVGPATAIEILSGAAAAAELARLIAAGDAAGLTRIRGVGKKRADMLVVELREKCEALLGRWGQSPASGAAARRVPDRRPEVLDDVASALVNLGWRAVEAERVVTRLEVPEGATFEVLLREALQAMRVQPR